MKILNLFAGIGGNRTLWGDEHEITAVENDQRIALIYSQRFPKDKVIIGDAYEYFINHFHEFEILWASPPCLSHTNLQRVQVGLRYNKKEYARPRLPDLRLYSLIIFCQKLFRGEWVIENVKTYYKPLIPPTTIIGRHYIWASCYIPSIKKKKKEHLSFDGKKSSFTIKDGYKLKRVDIDLSPYFEYKEEKQIINNCITPEEGLYILNHLLKKIKKKKQKSLYSFIK
nr:MAG: cytosine-specific methyltransferase [Lokiarchaeota virus Skoll Meg22_1214]